MSPSSIQSLHILNKRPSHPRFTACLDAVADGDVVLLIENAVVAFADADTRLPVDVLALAPDCHARGIESDHSTVDYAGMVALTERFQRVISW